MRQLMIIFLLLPLAAFSQQKIDRHKPVDSIQYYADSLHAMRKVAVKALKATASYQLIKNKKDYFLQHSNNYGSWNLFLGAAHSEYSSLNKTLTQDGFGALPAWAPYLGFGYTGKWDRIVFDMELATVSFTNTSTKGGENIKSYFGNFLETNIGYTIIQSRKIYVYPFAGIGLHEAYLDYTTPVQTNPSFTNITNLVENDQSVSGNSTKLGYQYGLNIDFVTGYNDKKNKGTILFLKLIGRGNFGNEIYHFRNSNINNITYQPGIKHENYAVEIGIKFFNRM